MQNARSGRRAWSWGEQNGREKWGQEGAVSIHSREVRDHGATTESGTVPLATPLVETGFFTITL